MMTWIGPYGALVQVPTPAAPLSAPAARRTSTFELGSGAVRQWRAREVARRWTWTIPWSSHDELATLVGLEQGMFGPPPWRWYDPVAAVSNMLPAGLMVGRGWGHNPTVAGPVTLPGGPTFPFSMAGTHQGPWDTGVDPDPAPVLPGRVYTAQVYVAGGAGRVELRFRDAAGATSHAHTSPLAEGWLSVSATAQPADVGVTMWVTSGIQGGGPQFVGHRLHEGRADGRWQPGGGIPKVSLSGMDQVYQLVEQRRNGTVHTRRDVTVELVEVA